MITLVEVKWPAEHNSAGFCYASSEKVWETFSSGFATFDLQISILKRNKNNGK
jgi:hypothetical protein